MEATGLDPGSPVCRRLCSVEAALGDGSARTRRYLKPELGVLAVAAAGVLYAFCCVVDTLSEQCLRRRPSANCLVADVSRTRWLLRERCSATCPRSRRPGQVRRTQGGLQITAVTRVCSVGLLGTSAAPEGSFWSMPWHFGCLQRPPVAGHCLTGLRACVSRGGERRISWHPTRGRKLPGLSVALIWLSQCSGASGRPLASPRVRLAARNPPPRPVAAQSTLSASSRMPLRPGSRLLGLQRGPLVAEPPADHRQVGPAGRAERRTGREAGRPAQSVRHRRGGQPGPDNFLRRQHPSILPAPAIPRVPR